MRRILIEITHISQYVVNIIIFLRLMKKSCDFNKIIRGIMTRQLVIFFFSLPYVFFGLLVKKNITSNLSLKHCTCKQKIMLKNSSDVNKSLLNVFVGLEFCE